MTTAQRYAFANEMAIDVALKISGGVPGYTVSYQLLKDGAVQSASEPVVTESGAAGYSAMPASAGTYTVAATVTDAAGNAASASVTLPVAARDPQNRSEWEAKLKGLELGEDWRENLIAVALTQLGYRESRIHFIVDDQGKTQGYTLYGEWYHLPYAEWCAMFISWCLDQAGIPASEFPYESGCEKWLEALDKLGAYRAVESGYQPARGDLVFFNWDEQPDPDHVGVVEWTDEKKIHTIEGNSGKRVAQQEYPLNDETIMGYVSTEALMLRAGVLATPTPAPTSTVEPSATPEPMPTIEPEATVEPTAEPTAEPTVEPTSSAEPGVRRAFTNVDDVTLRDQPSTDSERVGRIRNEGGEVAVLSEVEADGALWYQVRLGAQTAYIHGSLLDVTDETVSLPALSELGVRLGEINANGVNLRAEPTSHSDRVAGYDRGIQVVVLREVERGHHNWCEIQYGDSKAYVSAKLVDLIEEPTATPEPTAEPTPEPTTTPEPEIVYYCNLGEHAHEAACLDADGSFVCLLPVHAHTEDCTVMPTIDTAEETEQPIAAPEIICGIEAHSHDETCLDENGELVCGLEEHLHDWTCTPATYFCGLEEHAHSEACLPPEYLCGKAEHIHDETCLNADGIRCCGMLEHVHTDECFDENWALICTIEEHLHNDDCLVEPIYYCGFAAHAHDESCYDETGALVCELPEHAHTPECRVPAYYCGLTEHIHMEMCFDETGALICEIPEHLHDEACLVKVFEIELASDGIMLPLDGEFTPLTGVPLSFTNTLKLGDLSLTKTINGPDSGAEFQFNISLTYPNLNNTCTGVLTKDGEETEVEVVFVPNETTQLGEASVSVRLGHGDSFVIKGLPVDTEWTVLEQSSAGYKPTYKIGDGAEQGGLAASGTIGAEGSVVAYTNSTLYALPTGGELKNLYTAGAVCLILVLLMYSQRRNGRRGEWANR